MLPRGRRGWCVGCFGGIELATYLWIACAVLTLVASQQNFYIHTRYGKRHEPYAETFVSGSRYGRSEGLQRDSKSLPKFVQLVPRMDQFFWGSRYGKRSPLNYKSVSASSQFNSVLDLMDNVNRVNFNRDNDATYGNDLNTSS